MWDLENRGVIVLISVLSGSVLIYNAWGPILAVTVSLFFVIYACYSLITNDSLLSPHAFIVFDYLKEAALELRATVVSGSVYVTRSVRELWNTAIRRYYERSSFRMDRMNYRRSRRSYQLSSDSFTDTRNLSRFSLINQLSPIPRNRFVDNGENESENSYFRDADARPYDRPGAFGKHTSTPVTTQRKDDARNGDLGLYVPSRSPSNRTSPVQNHTSHRGENPSYAGSDGSPWSATISPKLRPKAGGVKTVQTVAGPLLASTRYNIDPKVYSDVTSPGLTTRLSKYATEANNKLTHQSQYGAGHFPRVNINAGPVPLLNAKSARMRMPVTVRIAPPETSRYSPPERQKILSNLCQSENKATPSVVQVLREISLKRHASREDVTSELAKKQRTDGHFSEDNESLEEIKQKRARDESSKSEEDLSPQNKATRPFKRTKTPSCYDILNSLSSSVHVASGVKRKAIDFSRSGTPDFEKHFKSLESMPSTSSDVSMQFQNVEAKQSRSKLNDKQFRADVYTVPNKTYEPQPLKGILKSPSKSPILNKSEEALQVNHVNIIKRTKNKTVDSVSSSTNLTNKLFMKAEPQRNEKLRSLIEEQGKIKVTFTSDDVEEIKKEDIINMRQTSMRARLKSMFDAISGKTASSINPDVVIQAEDLSASTPITTACATLNSSTTTTNVNTAPITTSAIAPLASSVEPDTRQTKHVAFNLPPTDTSQKPEKLQEKSNFNTETTETSIAVPETNIGKSETISNAPSTHTNTNVSTPSTSTIFSTPNLSSSTFNFGKPVSGTSLSSSNTPNAMINFGTPTSTSTSADSMTSVSTTTTTPSAISFGKSNVAPSIAASVSSTPTISSVSAVSSLANTSQTKSGTFSFGTSTANAQLETSKNTTFNFGNTSSSTATPTTSIALYTPSQSLTSNAQALGVSNSPSTSPVSLFTGNTNTISVAKSMENSIANTSTSISMLGAPKISSSISASIMGTLASNTTTTSSNATSLFTFGTSNSNLQTTQSELFSFTAPTSSTQSTSAFGNPTNTQIASTHVTPVTQATHVTPVTQATTTNYSFAPTSTSSIFSTNTTSSAFGATTTNSPFSFGTPTTTTSENKPAMFAFGRKTPTSSQNTMATASSNATTIFGNTGNSGNSTFGTPSTSSTPQFGTNTAPLFGNVTTTTGTFGSANSQPVFGGTSLGNFNPPKTTASSIFGSNVNTSFPATTTASTLFSSASTSTNTTTTSTSVFGSNTSIFGQAKPQTSFGTSSSVFGSTATPLFGSQTTTAAAAPPAFAINNTTTTSAPLTFGGTSTSTPAFGTQNVGMATPIQNNSSQVFGSPPMFGSESTTPASTFGTATNPATGNFGSNMPNAFGGQQSNLNFGTNNNNNNNNNNNSIFGQNTTNPFGAQATSAPTFGTASTSTPAFGNSGNNNTSGMFTFGGNQKPAQQNTSFAFGSNNNNNNNNAASSSTPFQFGASSSKPASTGYNFSLATTTPTINFGTSGTPTFSAPTSGSAMFNIGSGSTAPRSRNIRTRKPR